MLLKNYAGGMIRPYMRELSGIARGADLLLATGALWLANALYGYPWTADYTLAASVIALLFFLITEIFGLYRSWRSEPFRREIGRLVIVWIVLGAAVLFLGYATKSTQQYSRLAFGTWFWFSLLLVAGWRAAVRGLLRASRMQGRNTRRVAIAGSGELAVEVAKTFLNSPWMGLRLVAFYDDEAAPRAAGDLPAPRDGDLDALVETARTGALDVIYIALPTGTGEGIAQLVERLADTTVSVYVVPDFFIFHLTRGRWVQVGEIPAVSVYETPFYGIDGRLKRTEDLILGSLCLICGALPMFLIALGIKLSSPGPALFKQRRWGLDGREFRIWKFRTMTVADDGPELRQATRDDPRITRFGGFLRRTSLDELPQFFNVIAGSMSLIGPRPHASVHNAAYRKLIHGYMLRHKIRPGITGWAQANGWRGETDTAHKMEKRIELDLWYIRNWSLMLDLKILVLTAVRLLRDEKAY